jgi:hypothetical protein
VPPSPLAPALQTQITGGTTWRTTPRCSSTPTTASARRTPPCAWSRW